MSDDAQTIVSYPGSSLPPSPDKGEGGVVSHYNFMWFLVELMFLLSIPVV